MFFRYPIQPRNGYHQWLFICWRRLCVDDGRTPVPSTFTLKTISSENYFLGLFCLFFCHSRRFSLASICARVCNIRCMTQ